MSITITWDIKAFQDGEKKPCFECQFSGPPEMAPTWLGMMADFIDGLKAQAAVMDNLQLPKEDPDAN